MKKIIILLIISFSLFTIPLTSFAGNLFSTGLTIYLIGSSNNSTYPVSTTNIRPELSDGLISTADSISSNVALYGSFSTKKIIDQYQFRVPSDKNGWTGDLYFYDQFNNVVASFLDQAIVSNSPNVVTLPEPITAYKFKLVQDDGVSRFLSEIMFYEIEDTFAPSAPVMTTPTGGNMNVTLNWTKPPDIDLNGYKIYKNGQQIATITNINTLTYTVTNLTPGQSNQYNVTAYDDSNNESILSNTVYGTATDTTPPTPPDNLDATPGDNQVILNWSASTDNDKIEKYLIYVNGTFEKEVTTTTATVDNLFNLTSYQLTVIAVDPTGNISTPSTVNATPQDTIPPFQKQPTIGTVTENSIEILWEFSEDVDMIGGHYEVTKNNFNTFNEVQHTGNTNYDFTFDNLISGQTYLFKIRSVDDDGLKSLPKSISQTTTIDPPPTPTNLILSAGDNQIMLNWDDSGATDIAGYKIYVGNSLLTTVNESTYTHIGLPNLSPVCYQVSAFDTNNNESNKTVQQCETPIDLIPPFDVSNIDTISSTEYTYTFGWQKIPGQDTAYFKIYKNNLAFYNEPYVTGQDDYQYTATNLTPETVYTFKVNPVDDDGNELLTGTNGTIQISTFSTPPNAPTGLTATPGEGTVTLNWNENNETDVEGYKIYVNGTFLTTVNKQFQTYTHDTMNPNVKSYYITAYDIGNAESEPSNTVTASPVILSPDPIFQGFTLPITSGDIVESSFDLVSLLKWFIILGLAIWLAWKMIQLMRFSVNSKSSAPTIDDSGTKIVEKKLEEQKEQRKQIERMKETMNKKR